MTSRLLLLLAVLFPASLRAEQVGLEVLAEINFARTQPKAYAEIVEARINSFRGSEGPQAVREAVEFLRKVKSVPPMAWSVGMEQAAQSHSRDVGSRGARGPPRADGTMPWDRLTRFGKWRGHVGENIDYGHRDARSIVVSLIIGNGVPQRYHRKNLFNPRFLTIGIAVSPHARTRTMCVMKFATSFIEGGTARIAGRSDPGFRSEYSGNSFF